MAQSLISRVNQINSQPAQKAAPDWSDFPYYGGFDSGNRDFTATEYGAAQASQLLVDIAASLNVWEQWLDGITWHIKDISTGATIVSTDQRQIPDGERGARFFNAIKRFRQRYKHSYWKSIATSDWIAGETYIRRVRNVAHIPTDLQWLNPLATRPNTATGQITWYWYNNQDSPEVGTKIPIQDMAYRMLRRNIFDDLRGYSTILSVIDESNLSRNVKRAFRQYFRNGMILGGIISPLSEDATYSPSETERIESMLRRQHNGVDNAHRWIISPRRFFAEQFETKNIAKDIAVLNDLSHAIHKAIGVPEELAGNPTNATYENLEATQYGWYRFKGIPYAKDIAEYHNNQIIPFIEPSGGIYLEPELSKYEIERPEVVSQDVNAGLLDLYEAALKRGQNPSEKLKGIHLIGSRPMHIDIITKLANTMPGEELESRANAEESIANAEAKPLETQADVISATDTPEPTALPATTPASEDVPEGDEETPDSEKSVIISHGDHEHIVPIETYEYTPEKALDELKAWKKFHKNDPSRDFEALYLRGDVADMLRAATDKSVAFDSAFDTVRTWTKTIQATRLDFENDFEDLLAKARDDSNNYGRTQWASAVRKIIRRYGYRAFEDGLVIGGVLDGELSEEDENTFASIYAEQSQHVTNLGAQIFRTEEGVSDALAEQKASMWYRKSIAPFFDAGRESADANGMYEFAGDDGQESCSTCKRLKGQRHRLKSYARKGLRPGVDTDNFECGGWQCEHKLVKVQAKARGNF